MTILGIIGLAALVFGLMTPESGLMASATGNSNGYNGNHNSKNGGNYGNNHNHDDDHDDDDNHSSSPSKVTIYKVVINNAGNPTPPMASFGIKLNDTSVTVNGTTVTIPKNKPVALTEAGLAGYEFVEIRGDGHCPENLGGTITLDAGQDITCYVVNQPVNPTLPQEPGVIFQYNTLDFNKLDPIMGDSCSAPGKTAPCVELANFGIDGSILVVDDELKTDTTIILFSVVEQGKITQTPPQFASSPLCTLTGMGPHTAAYAQDPDNFPVVNPTGKLGFEFQCSLSEANAFKFSYALIETQRG